MDVDRPTKIPIRKLIGNLTTPQFYGFIFGIGALLFVAYKIGYWARGLEESAKFAQQKTTDIIAQAFRSMRTEYIPYKKEESRVAVVDTGPLRYTILIQLEEVPIPQSIRLQVGSVLAQPDSYENHHNILLVAARGIFQQFEGDLMMNGVSIVYVADPDAQGKQVELKRDGDKILAGKKRLYDGERMLWPSGGNGPFDIE